MKILEDFFGRQRGAFAPFFVIYPFPEKRVLIIYHLLLKDDELESGKWVTVAIGQNQDKKAVKIKVPVGANRGMRLRVKGKGVDQEGTTGDLYIVLD